MALRENLLKKIEIDRLAHQVFDSLIPAAGGAPLNMDKQAMRSLLTIAGYIYERNRDLDLYYLKDQKEVPSQFIVLDNDLAVYSTTLEDVVMRKSPYVKEMVSIRNIIKILNDGDVIRSKKADTVKLVHGQCLATLDLTIKSSDLNDIKRSGFVAYESGDAKEVLICVSLFAELIGYHPAPPFLALTDYTIIGGTTTTHAGVRIYGPHVIYNTTFNQLKFSSALIKQVETEKIELFQNIVQGIAAADKEGADVLSFLHEAAQGVRSVSNNLLPGSVMSFQAGPGIL